VDEHKAERLEPEGTAPHPQDVNEIGEALAPTAYRTSTWPIMPSPSWGMQ